MKIGRYLPQALETLGLSRGEARVYLCVLKKPGMEISDLKSTTDYSSAGVYKIVNSLVEKGFLKASGVPFVLQASPLHDIATHFSAQGRKLERIAGKLKDLSRLAKIPFETEVYEGTDLTDFYLNIPHKIEDFLWCIGSFKAALTFMGQGTEESFIKSRVKRGIHADAVIFDKFDKSEELARRDVKEKRETRFIQCGEYPLEFGYLFGNTFLNFYRDSEGKTKVIRTESPEFARAKLLQCQALWNSTAQ